MDSGQYTLTFRSMHIIATSLNTLKCQKLQWNLVKAGEANVSSLAVLHDTKFSTFLQAVKYSPPDTYMQYLRLQKSKKNIINSWKNAFCTNLPDCGRKLNGCLWCWGCPAEPTFYRQPKHSVTWRLTTGTQWYFYLHLWASGGSSLRSVSLTRIQNWTGWSARLPSATPFCSRSRRQR